MNPALRFLETMGRRPELRYGAAASLYASLQDSEVPQAVRWAVLRRDASLLAQALDARTALHCSLARFDGGVEAGTDAADVLPVASCRE